MSRLAILATHPVQYYSPLFRELAGRVDLHVLYAHRATPEQQAAAGFDRAFEWDVDLTGGYSHEFLRNVAEHPGADRFTGCDTPDVGARLREGAFDAVLMLGWHRKSMLQGLWAAKRLGMHTLVRGDSQVDTPRGVVKTYVKALTYPQFLRLFDAGLYVGLRNRAYYEHYKYPAERLFHSPHCVDTERFAAAATPEVRSSLRASLGIEEAAKIVLFAGKLVPFKRPLDLVEAVARLRSKGFPMHLMVAGSGPLEPAIAARAASLGIPCHRLGFCNQSAMPAAYAAADVLSLPSTGHETWGLVCNEALACGCPLVVSEQIGSAPDLATDNAVGRRHPVGDVDKLAYALAACLRSPPPRSAIRAVSDRFSLRAAANGIVQALESISPRSTSVRASHNL